MVNGYSTSSNPFDPDKKCYTNLRLRNQSINGLNLFYKAAAFLPVCFLLLFKKYSKKIPVKSKHINP